MLARFKKYKGVNPVTMKLADGSRVIYYYAWRGKDAPRLAGKPGSFEFDTAFAEAIAKRVRPSETLLGVMQAYQKSDAFLSLRATTRTDYIKQIRRIEARFATFPTDSLEDKRARGIFRSWRDELALKSKRQADYAWTVLARILSWALDGGMVPANPCQRGGRIYKGTRVDMIWSDKQIAQFLVTAPAYLHLSFLLALWTGQREGDLLNLRWDQYDGTQIRLTQSKTGREVVIPVGEPLKRALDAGKGTEGTILRNSRGEPWKQNSFQNAFQEARDKAGVEGVTFNDLRGTAVTRLAIAGCTEPEIITISGHSGQQVSRILERHYLHRHPKLAANAIAKLEAAYGVLQNGAK